MTDTIEQQLLDLSNEEGIEPFVRDILQHMAVQKTLADIEQAGDPR